jgi:heat shock protein HtpX
MATYKGMLSFKRSNERKIALLLILFPLFLFVMTWIINTFLFTHGQFWTTRIGASLFVAFRIFITYILPLVLVWGFTVFRFHKKIMFRLAGAKEITRKEQPEIYNIVENLCISRGLTMIKI